MSERGPEGVIAVGVAWGIVVVVLSLLGWAGQTLSWLAPRTAQQWGLSERKGTVEPVYWADIRGEAVWDAFTLWTLPVAGALLIVDSEAWAYFGLIGGGMYLYFAGRGILTRAAMQGGGFRIGAESNIKAVYGFLAAWGLMAAVTIVAAVVALPTS